MDEVIRGLCERHGIGSFCFYLLTALGTYFANHELDEPDARISSLTAHLLRQAAAAQEEEQDQAPLRLVEKRQKE